MKDYSTYTVEDFMPDASFVACVRGTDPAAVQDWEAWLTRQPLADEAARIIGRLTGSVPGRRRKQRRYGVASKAAWNGPFRESTPPQSRASLHSGHSSMWASGPPSSPGCCSWPGRVLGHATLQLTDALLYHAARPAVRQRPGQQSDSAHAAGGFCPESDNGWYGREAERRRHRSDPNATNGVVHVIDKVLVA